jgi:hypothetical protein
MSSGGSRFAWVALIAALALAACGESPEPAASRQPAASPTPASGPAASQTAAGNDVDSPPAIRDADLPLLPVTPFPAARPMEIVRVVYTFAAKHPEVLSKVPCFCGCENRGHRHNDDCFVASRDARGVPTAWEPHGVG